MKATDVLSEEHRVIERVLDTLEAGSNQLDMGQSVRPEFFLAATDFMRGFADGCHHKKEEGVLFKHMEKQGMPVEGSPIGVMLAEHEMGRQYTRALHAAALDLQAGKIDAAPRIVQNSRGYVALLRQHIKKEDNILFPMANKLIPVGQHDSVWEGFEHVEHAETGEGVHEKYLALADELRREVSG